MLRISRARSASGGTPTIAAPAAGAAKRLARSLREYGIQSIGIRVGDRTGRGYRRPDFLDAWSRYLPTENEHEEIRNNRNIRNTDAVIASNAPVVADVADVALVADEPGFREWNSITMDLYVHEFETARRREQVTDRLTAALGGLIESDKF